MTPRAAGVAEAVSARVQRQEILDDASKHFSFVVPETLLHNQLAEPDDMLAQLRRLEQVAKQDNVTLRMIPAEERWPYPPFHGFLLLDHRHVVIDLANTIVVTHGQSDILFFRNIFDALERRATLEIEPILDRYRKRYLQLAARG